LAYHNQVENKLFVPAIKELESGLKIKRKKWKPEYILSLPNLRL
jgi:hypothetical protein